MSNICFTFGYFFAQVADQPVIAIELMIKRLQSKMSGTNMRNFVCVIKSILFDSGEKTDEGLQGERQRVEEMNLDRVKSTEDHHRLQD